MSREVLLTYEAQQQMHLAADWYSERNPRVADEWFAGLASAIVKIGEDPERYPAARENDVYPDDLREMLYGLGKRITHRVLFVIHPNHVLIHHIRHVAQPDVT